MTKLHRTSHPLSVACPGQAGIPEQPRGDRPLLMSLSLLLSELNRERAQLVGQKGQHEPLLSGRVSGLLPSSCACLALLSSRKPTPGKALARLSPQAVTQWWIQGVGSKLLCKVTAVLLKLLLLRQSSQRDSTHTTLPHRALPLVSLSSATSAATVMKDC